jgi:hypothetical protein
VRLESGIEHAAMLHLCNLKVNPAKVIGGAAFCPARFTAQVIRRALWRVCRRLKRVAQFDLPLSVEAAPCAIIARWLSARPAEPYETLASFNISAPAFLHPDIP